MRNSVSKMNQISLEKKQRLMFSYWRENNFAINTQLSLILDFCLSALISILRITTSYLQHLLTAAEAGQCRSEQGWFLHSWKKMRRLSPGCLTLKSLYSVQWLGHDLAYQPNSERWAPLLHCELGTFVSRELSRNRMNKKRR